MANRCGEGARQSGFMGDHSGFCPLAANSSYEFDSESFDGRPRLLPSDCGKYQHGAVGRQGKWIGSAGHKLPWRF